MKKKKAEKAITRAAAPNAPAPMPAFLADFPISALASSTSERTRVETSAMALWTRVPTEGSPAAVVVSRWAGDTLWATGGSSFGWLCLINRAGQGMVPHDGRSARPGPLRGPAASLRAVGGTVSFSVLG